MSKILVVGSMGYDSITTPCGRIESTMGGSANYFATAASLFTQIYVTGVVGQDYKEEDLSFLRDRHVDLEGVVQIQGSTFRWSGRYEQDMNEAITLETQLNVLSQFHPVLPQKYRQIPYVFLANIDPDLQMQVLEQMEQPRLIGADTMNYWIDNRLSSLKKLLTKIDVLMINEGELRKLTQDWNAISAVQKVAQMGPRAIIIKRGEYGFLLFMEGKYFILPAFPVLKVVDPTGAGDTFAGGVFGYLAKMNQDLTFDHLQQACIYGCLMASFTVQDFGLNSLRHLHVEDLRKRETQYFQITQLPFKTRP